MNQKLSDLYKETANQTNTTEEQVKAVVEEMWYAVRQQIANAEGHNMLIHHLGNFKMPTGALDKYIETVEKAYKEGRMIQKKYEKGIENLRRVKQLVEQNESRV